MTASSKSKHVGGFELQRKCAASTLASSCIRHTSVGVGDLPTHMLAVVRSGHNCSIFICNIEPTCQKVCFYAQNYDSCPFKTLICPHQKRFFFCKEIFLYSVFGTLSLHTTTHVSMIKMVTVGPYCRIILKRAPKRGYISK